MHELPSWVRGAVACLLIVVLGAAPAFAAREPYGGATPQELVARAQAAAEAGDFGELMACMPPEDRQAMGGMIVMMAVMMVAFSQMGAEMGGAMASGMMEGLSDEEPTAEQKAELEAAQAAAAASAAAMEAKLRAALEPHGLAGMLDEPEPGSEAERELDEALDRADMIALTESMFALLGELEELEASDEAEDGDEAGEDDGEAPGPMDELEPEWIDLGVTDYQVDGDRATARAGDETIEMIRVDGRWYFAPQMTMDEGPDDLPADGGEGAWEEEGEASGGEGAGEPDGR